MVQAPNNEHQASIYVGDLHHDVTETELHQIFSQAGPVDSIRVCRDSKTKRSLGYGFVNFRDIDDAQKAIDTLNYSSIAGRSCRIMWSRRDPSERNSCVGNIYIKNLDLNIDNKELYDGFIQFGNILSAKVACSGNGRSRGYGFVHFERKEAAEAALEAMHGTLFGDRAIQVSQVVKRGDRDETKDDPTNLYVKNLPAESFGEDDLNELFSAYGAIQSSCIMQDKQGRKFGFVNFEDSEASRQAAQELHGRDMRSEEQKADESSNAEDFALYVAPALTKTARRQQAQAAASNQQHERNGRQQEKVVSRRKKPGVEARPVQKQHKQNVTRAVMADQAWHTYYGRHSWSQAEASAPRWSSHGWSDRRTQASWSQHWHQERWSSSSQAVSGERWYPKSWESPAQATYPGERWSRSISAQASPGEHWKAVTSEDTPPAKADCRPEGMDSPPPVPPIMPRFLEYQL